MQKRLEESKRSSTHEKLMPCLIAENLRAVAVLTTILTLEAGGATTSESDWGEAALRLELGCGVLSPGDVTCPTWPSGFILSTSSVVDLPGVSADSSVADSSVLTVSLEPSAREHSGVVDRESSALALFPAAVFVTCWDDIDGTKCWAGIASSFPWFAVRSVEPVAALGCAAGEGE
jgi:hypothetical protein